MQQVSHTASTIGTQLYYCSSVTVCLIEEHWWIVSFLQGLQFTEV